MEMFFGFVVGGLVITVIACLVLVLLMHREVKTLKDVSENRLHWMREMSSDIAKLQHLMETKDYKRACLQRQLRELDEEDDGK